MRPFSRTLVVLWALALLAAGVIPVWGQGFGQPQLAVTQTVDRPTVAPGDVITYTLTIGNQGTGMATGIAVSDVLPQGTTFVDTTGNGILFGNTVYWSPGSLAPNQTGTLALRVRVNPGLPNGTTIANTAQISSVEAPIGVPGNTTTVTVGSVTTPSPLVVTKQVDASSATPGQPLNYTLTVTNSGAIPTNNVVLTDPIPAGTTAVSATDGGGIGGGVATWALGTLPAQGTRQVSLQVQVNPNASGTITNQAQASSAEAPAPVSSNSVSVLVNAAPSLTLTKTVDKQAAAAGDILTYTLAFTNNGLTPLSNGSLSDMVPAGTQFVDASNNGLLSGNVVVWSFSNLGPGTGGVVSFRVRVLPGAAPGTQITNQAQLAILSQGTLINSNPVVTTIGGAASALTLAKAVDRTTANVGDVLTYTLSYVNLSAAPANGVQILDPLPAGLAFLDAQGNVQIDIPTRTLRFDVGTVAPNAIGTVSFRARVDASVAGGTSLANQASITAPGLSQPVASNTVTTVIGGGAASAYTGTYRLLEGLNPTSMTVDPQNKFTVITVARDGLTPGLGAQGSLRPDGSFDVTDTSGRIRFFGQVSPSSGQAGVTIQRFGPPSYSVILPKAPDVNPLPATFVGTFAGTGTNTRGDRLSVQMTVDPGGNSTFQADLIQLFPTLIRHRSGSYQVSPNGALSFGGRTDGVLQPAGNSLVLVYNYITTGYQSTFQIPLVRR
jgi:uncharacterized repeat protein (TIGR01451 family)